MIDGREALERLREGNRRFVEEERLHDVLSSHARRRALTDSQTPFAIILGCSDSRVPAEIVFDQGLGDLFVIRVAGNIVAPSQIGSIEFAAARFGTRLVVVLGHTRCGAVQATLEELTSPCEARSRNLQSIVDRIRPAVAPLFESGTPVLDEELLLKAVRLNVHATVRQLRHGSPIIEGMIQSGALLVAGAEYSLDSGRVTFLDPIPD